MSSFVPGDRFGEPLSERPSALAHCVGAGKERGSDRTRRGEGGGSPILCEAACWTPGVGLVGEVVVSIGIAGGG